jgi:predicted kinase
MEAILISMTGRTAAGKTSLAKYLVAKIPAHYVPEAAIKRLFRPNYTTRDSLDEELRDVAYAAAIAAAAEYTAKGEIVVLDAAFHALSRRHRLYESIIGESAGLVMLYCLCDDLSQVRTRIERRLSVPGLPETQANSMSIYEFIDANFDELQPQEFPAKVPTTLFRLDTARNSLESVVTYGIATRMHQDYVARIGSLVRAYLQERNACCSL